MKGAHDVSLLVRVTAAHDAEHLRRLREQLPPEVQLVVVNALAHAADLSVDGATVASTSPCVVSGWQAALAAASGRTIAFAAPGCRLLPDGLREAVARLDANPETAVVLGSAPATVGCTEGDLPWLPAALVRREVVESWQPWTFFPGEVADLQRRRSLASTVTIQSCWWDCPASVGTGIQRQLRADARMLSAWSQPGPAEIQCTVLISTYQRRATLLNSLESFAGQELAAGSFEIVVTDDESPDGTGPLLDELQWAVPFKLVRRQRSGLAAARNAGLAVAEGRLVLIVNDDTIALPDLIGEHLRAHQQAGPQPVAVLGRFDQPPAALDNALMRVIEHSSFGFPYAGMQAGQRYSWHKFWTCNLSVPRATLLAAGGMDEDFECYGCEDSDLGYRLGQGGLEVVFHPAARAYHEHLHDLPALRRRQTTLARANVRFFAKNPAALAEPTWQGLRTLTRAGCEATLAARGAELEALEAAADRLACLDLGRLSASGRRGQQLAEQTSKQLHDLLQALNGGWWAAGTAAGLADEAAASYAELEQRPAPKRHLRQFGSAIPWPLATTAKLRLLAWPRWHEDADWRYLFGELGHLLARPGVCLCVRLDPVCDAVAEPPAEFVARQFRRFCSSECNGEVLILDDALTAHDSRRLGNALSAWLLLPTPPRAVTTTLQRATGLPTITDGAGLQAMLRQIPVNPLAETVPAR